MRRRDEMHTCDVKINYTQNIKQLYASISNGNVQHTYSWFRFRMILQNEKLYISLELEIRNILPYHFNYLCKNNVEASWSFLLYSHVYNINLERDSIKAYTRKCGYLGTGSRFAHSSRKYLLTLLIVMTGYVYTYH